MIIKSVTKTSTKTVSEIWAKYIDVSNWNTWDKDLESSSLDGEFAVGGTGVVTPKDAPKSKITITKLEENKNLVFVCKMPFATIHFKHFIKLNDNSGCEVTHEVELDGFLAPLWNLIIGKSLVAGLDTAVDNITK